ncbi:MAG: alkaline phosphatase D family protein [Desulfococcaceae bacterium]
MKTRRTFQNGALERMATVGAVTARTARIWIRNPAEGLPSIQWWPEDRSESPSQSAFSMPPDPDRDFTGGVRITGLEPLTRYGFRVAGPDNQPVGEGGFETAPESPDETPPRFSIALMSCNQPFTPAGDVPESVEEMFGAVRQVLRKHETRFVFLLGDQIYSDLPPTLSLFNPDYFSSVAPPGRRRIQDCAPEEVRRIFQERYRYFWNLPGWLRLQAEYPCYPILDDHDIVDNWGSVLEHRTPEWASLGEGAFRAYQDYQASRMAEAGRFLPPDFDFEVSYGNTATYVLDIRTHRTPGEKGRLYSDEQAEKFHGFLRKYRDRQVIFVGLSVPVVHLPGFMARMAARFPYAGEDFSDRWSSGGHIRDRDRLLHLLRDHQRRNPGQLIVLLSGDIHIGCVHTIQWTQGGRTIHQLISSGITHKPVGWMQLGSELVIRMNRRIETEDRRLTGTVRPARGTPRHRRNPTGGLNMGLVEVETPSPGARPTLRFYLYGHRRGKPICRFRSAAVGGE